MFRRQLQDHTEHAEIQGITVKINVMNRKLVTRETRKLPQIYNGSGSSF
jgi:hypothetical protein